MPAQIAFDGAPAGGERLDRERDVGLLELLESLQLRDDAEMPEREGRRERLGEPTGVLREESAWHFRDAFVRPSEDELVEILESAKLKELVIVRTTQINRCEY